jgi:hypothetical protein
LNLRNLRNLRLTILLIVFLFVDVLAGVVQFLLQAFPFFVGQAALSEESLVDADLRLLGFEASGFRACEFSAANPLMDSLLLAVFALIDGGCRSGDW